MAARKFRPAKEMIMPIRKLVNLHTRPPSARKLADELLEEWRSPSENPEKPVIIEDGGSRKPVHLYVIWNAWNDLDQIERSELIMDVYEQLFGLEKAAEV